MEVMVSIMMNDTYSFKGRNVLITGGSSGIGLSTARHFSENGSNVVLVARNKNKLETAARSIGGNIDTFSVDISDPKAVIKLHESIENNHGSLDFLINSAGIVYPGRLEDLTFDQLISQINVNLIGTILVTKALLPLITKGGHIVNISSVAGFIGLYGYTGYSASKFGILGFSEALRMELRTREIGVSVVFPPDTDTPQLEFENRIKPEELRSISSRIEAISPDAVARSISKGIKSGDFMIFPDMGSRSTYIASRMAGTIMRSWMDRQIKKSRQGNE
jgi:3-dehydrosphinganine reductase